jgi:hypothetical protein
MLWIGNQTYLSQKAKRAKEEKRRKRERRII